MVSNQLKNDPGHASGECALFGLGYLHTRSLSSSQGSLPSRRHVSFPISGIAKTARASLAGALQGCLREVGIREKCRTQIVCNNIIPTTVTKKPIAVTAAKHRSTLSIQPPPKKVQL